MLLLHANEPVARERLIEELWGGAAPRTVNAVLNVYLSKLRRLLADGTGEQLLLTQAAGYVLSVPPQGLDARRFESLLERGRQQLASGDPEHASTTLRDALALWRGPPLADLAFESFAQTEIARLEELRLTALEARIDADLALGRQDSLVAELETLVATHPYREGLRAQLMLALYRNGRQAEALETYRRARRTFTEELGIEPGPRLQELEGAILRHDASLEAPRPEAPRVREEEWTETVRQRRFPTRWAFALGAALMLATVGGVVAAARNSPGDTPEPLPLAGDSVAIVDPGTNTIVGEIPVGGRPVGPAVGEGSVWVGNRDDKTILRIDPSSREVVRTIGIGVVPTDIEVGVGGVWVLSDWALLRIDSATNDVVATVGLPRRTGLAWTNMEIGATAIYACRCVPIPVPGLVRIDPVSREVTSVRERPVGHIAYGEGALWALTGYEADTLERIDPETKAVVAMIPLERVGELHGYRPRIVVGEGAIWVASRHSLWKIDPATNRLVGTVPVGIEAEGRVATGKNEGSFAAGYGALWALTFGRGVLRVDPESQSVATTIPLGTLIYPANLDAIAVGEGAVWMAVTSYGS